MCIPVITKPQVQCAFLWSPSHKCSVHSCDHQATSTVCILWLLSRKCSVHSCDHQATSAVCVPVIAKPQVQCVFLWSPSHKCSVRFCDRQTASAMCIPVIAKPQVQCAFLWSPSHKYSVQWLSTTQPLKMFLEPTTSRGCTSGGVYVPCIYTHARWELP